MKNNHWKTLLTIAGAALLCAAIWGDSTRSSRAC
jgi:hypothetical protein